MKLKAIPFHDAFPRSPWAQHEIFDGYLAVIPFEGRADTREYNRARRENLRRVLELAIEELEHGLATTRRRRPNPRKRKSPSSSHGQGKRSSRYSSPKVLLARLKRIKVYKTRLPRQIRIRYGEVIRTYRSRNNDIRVLTGTVIREPEARLVKLQDLIDFGIDVVCDRERNEASEPDGQIYGEDHAQGLS